jgi:hypothetical protein
LNWSIPSLNEVGTALTGIAGYRIRYGTSPSNLTGSVDVIDASATRFVVTNLSVGTTYYFSVLTLTSSGDVSTASSVASVKVP